MRDMPSLQQIEIFILIVKHKAFYKAAKELNVSPPTLTIAINNLEETLGVRLLNRSTRSLSLTPVGEEFLHDISPILNNYKCVIDKVNYHKLNPEGIVRINLPRIALDIFFQSYISNFKIENPNIKLELFTTDSIINIIYSGFDAGIRYYQDIPKDMIAIPFGESLSLIPVASPEFVKYSGEPSSPHDLVNFKCINRCFPSGGIYRWEFINGKGEKTKFSVRGDLVLDSDYAMIQAAESGLGIAFVYENIVIDKIKENKLVHLLKDYNYPSERFHLYYPSRKHIPVALRLFITYVMSMNEILRTTSL